MSYLVDRGQDVSAARGQHTLEHCGDRLEVLVNMLDLRCLRTFRHGLPIKDVVCLKVILAAVVRFVLRDFDHQVNQV